MCNAVYSKTQKICYAWCSIYKNSNLDRFQLSGHITGVLKDLVLRRIFLCYFSERKNIGNRTLRQDTASSHYRSIRAGITSQRGPRTPMRKLQYKIGENH
eukprot:IDg18594t1